MIDPETAITATVMASTFLEAEHQGALPQQLPRLVALLGQGLLLASLDLAAATIAQELSTV